jgi:hypothetical protein
MDPNPNETPNVGSFFKNPIVSNDVALKILAKFPNAKFFPIDEKYTNTYHPATAKIFTLYDYLQESNDDVIILLDSDAWIQNPSIINNIITHLLDSPQKQGCFSRDPYFHVCTFINSGSFILKVNDYTQNMLSTLKQYIIEHLSNFDYNIWPYDQYYYCYYILQHKSDFIIFQPDVLNTPNGSGLRHNWTKKQQMYNDLNALLNDCNIELNTQFDINNYIDTQTYPNKECAPDNFPFCLSM